MQFRSILSHENKKKDKFSTQKNLAKFLKD